MRLLLPSLFFVLATAGTVSSQVVKEEETNYLNNYYSAEAMKELHRKPDDLKYESAGDALNLTHKSKGLDLYASSQIFPRRDYIEGIRDFSMSFDLAFTEGSGGESLFGFDFFVIPDEDVEYKDSMASIMLVISAEGKLYSIANKVPLPPGVDMTSVNLDPLNKELRKVKLTEVVPGSPIEGFNAGGTNRFSLTRVDDNWKLSINDKLVKEWSNMGKGYFSSRQGPIVIMNGKTSVKLSKLNERYGYQNASMRAYLDKVKGSGLAEISGSCVSKSAPMLYQVTTKYGWPTIKLSWKEAALNGKEVYEYFDFKGDSFSGYEYRGLSDKSIYALMGKSGKAQNIRVRPEEGTISFDFYPSDAVSSSTSGDYMTIRQGYCSLSIMRKE